MQVDDLKKSGDKTLINTFFQHIKDKEFPCVGAKAALAHNQIKFFLAEDMACSKADKEILNFLYSFVDNFRKAENKFHSAVILFKAPEIVCEHQFEKYLWERLQSFSDMDSENYGYDKRVTSNPQAPDFSFSIKEEAFFVIGLHPKSNRPARQFPSPALVFNPHIQFEELRETGKFDAMQNAIRKRDKKLAGSINPMLKNFGEASEAWQYSGINYDATWKCPLNIKHAK